MSTERSKSSSPNLEKTWGLKILSSQKRDHRLLFEEKELESFSPNVNNKSSTRPILECPLSSAFPSMSNAGYSTSIRSKIESETIKTIALNEDPSIFDYDSFYNKKELKQSKISEKKPKYMESILKRAQERKLENEKFSIMRAQKERKKEDPVFSEKEQFITRAYKQKLTEIEKQDKKSSFLSQKPNMLSMPEYCKVLLDKDYRRGRKH